jgi:superfamily II DNA or RNA helicase
MITTRGYVISQSTITKKLKNELMKELTITPIEIGSSSISQEQRDFPIWRENAAATKFYTPRFFGLNRWGIPPIIKLPLGDPISVTFKGSLRPIQEPIVAKTLQHFRENGPNGAGGALLELYCAIGKTVCALNMISQIGRKTIIMVHKEFLMNQWIERAAEFLPTAKIGKIQGRIWDIEGKDIVIGMIQSMYDRDFPQGAFDSFGFAIFDEVHRFGSEQFSKIFWRFSTYHMLGITATLARKDGTSLAILANFIGPVIYTITDRGRENVSVMAITYTDNAKGGVDAPYLKQERDYRGNIKYSTMISNVCSYIPRTRGIYSIIVNLLARYPDSQIMVLVHNLCLLSDLESIIMEDPNAATYGFYVGGMKRAALEETEKKQIVLASYSMAAEALDIKTLNIVCLASSKTDVVQSIGRILRDRGKTPKIVVDIIDPNPTFENQWRKRLAYYKKCQYDVFRCNKWEDYLTTPFYDDETSGTNKWKRPKNITKCLGGETDSDNDENETPQKEIVCLIDF